MLLYSSDEVWHNFSNKIIFLQNQQRAFIYEPTFIRHDRTIEQPRNG